MQHQFPILFENEPKETMRNNYFVVENIQVIAEGELVKRFAVGTICVLCNNNFLQSLVFKVGDVN